MSTLRQLLMLKRSCCECIEIVRKSLNLLTALIESVHDEIC